MNNPIHHISVSTSNLPNYATNIPLTVHHSAVSLHTNNINTNSSNSDNKFGTVKTKKKFDKSQISGPTNFRVVQHVGLNNNNFEVILII